MVQVTGLAVCFGFALHTYGSATVAKQQYPPHRSSLKTVHRTVLLTLRPSQVQVLINMKKQHIPPKGVCCLVQVTGLEPARIAPLDPKSSVFANFTIPAFIEIRLV